MTMMNNNSAFISNPLLDFSGLPAFDRISTEHITPAIDTLLADARQLIEQLDTIQQAPTWQNLVLPLTEANEKLSRAWGVVGHLNAVMNNPTLRETYNANLPKITEYFSEIAQHPGLFKAFKQMRNSTTFATLSVARKKVIENELRDFHLGGAELTGEEQTRFRELQSELAQLSSRFEENLLDATNAFALYVEEKEQLAGLPEDLLFAAQEAAKKDDRQGWKFTLHAPSWIPFMQYVRNRGLREQMYRAYVTRASEFGAPEFDNTALMEQIVVLRQELAGLLGYTHYADVSLVSKMAETPQQIENFLRELAQRARPFAEQDYAELRQFAHEKLDIPELNAWDIAFASEQLRESRYRFSEQEVRQYFPESQVLAGLFNLVNKLYGIQVRPSSTAVWHTDVRFYEIVDASNRLLGQFYLDMYAREHKRGGAWMDDVVTRRNKDGHIQIPVAYLTCNFSAPSGSKEALFTHDEVITLFHEFGHGLHHLLTQVDELAVSGIHGVEWDAVELPSQFMENFCWEWDVLTQMTRHIDTGAILPRHLFDSMVAAKNFQSGLFTLRQVEFALFDLLLHTGFRQAGESIQQLLGQVRQQIAVIVPPEYNRFAQSFSHIFAGGYAAGYYSYKWAEVLSADVYSLFEEQGIISSDVGQHFWQEILAVGGTRPARESFIAFRQREPRIDALLRHHGMTDGTAGRTAT